MFRITLALLIPLVLAPSWAKAEALAPSRLPLGVSKTWAGWQHLGADKEGNVFVLRSDTLEVFPLVDGKLGKPARLETSRPVGSIGEDAAMGEDSGDWLIRVGFGLRRFQNGKEVPQATVPWEPKTVALVRGAPFAGVLPIPQSKAALGFEGERDLPLIASLSATGWSAAVNQPFTDTGSEDLRYRGPDLMAQRLVELAPDKRGRFWAASANFYQVRQFSPTGRLLLEIASGHQEADLKDSAVGIRRVTADLEQRGVDTSKGTVLSFEARRAIHSLTLGPDGRLYLLINRVEGATRLCLDRYDPATGVVERLPLRLKAEGWVLGMVAGKDGLYLASWAADGGRWSIPWTALDEAEWKPAPGVRVSGSAGVDAEPAMETPKTTPSLTPG